MSTITLLFFGRRHIEKVEAIEKNGQIAEASHQETVKAIVSAHKTADNLKRALEKNHISVEIKNATGNKHEPATTRPTPS